MHSEHLTLSKYFVYIMNSPTGILYTGVTNDLMRHVLRTQAQSN